jgi:hypothetical protein
MLIDRLLLIEQSRIAAADSSVGQTRVVHVMIAQMAFAARTGKICAVKGEELEDWPDPIEVSE